VRSWRRGAAIWLGLGLGAGLGIAYAQDAAPPSSYAPVVMRESFAQVMARMKAAKPDLARRHKTLLNARYDLANRPAAGVTMARGKSVQGGVRVKPSAGMTWAPLDQLSPDEIRSRDAFPPGFLPLPHANHSEGGPPTSTAIRSSPPRRA